MSVKTYKVDVMRCFEPRPKARKEGEYRTAYQVRQWPMSSNPALPDRTVTFKEFATQEQARVFTLRNDNWEVV